MSINELHATPTQSGKPRLTCLQSVWWHLKIWGVPPADIGKSDFRGRDLPSRGKAVNRENF